MNGHTQTHYDTLGVHPSATFGEIRAAYKKIVDEHDPVHLGPFSRMRAKKLVEDANIAWDILSDSALRAVYDKKIGPQLNENAGRANGQNPSMNPFNPRSWNGGNKSSGFFNSSNSARSRDPRQTDGDSGDAMEDDANTADEAPCYDEAAYRYVQAETGTVIDISISKWRLQLNLSPKFRFLDDVLELSDPVDKETVSFQFGLTYNTNSREAWEATINELTVKVISLPDTIGLGEDRELTTEKWAIASLQTIFKETLSDLPTLTLSMTAEPLPSNECHFLWEFGFDFDLNRGVQSHRRGTCLMFSRHEYLDYFRHYVGADSPEFVLKRDKEVKADVFMNMADKKLIELKYGNVKMWRLAAVGGKGNAT